MPIRIIGNNLHSFFDLLKRPPMLGQATYLLEKATTAFLIFSLFGGSISYAQRSLLGYNRNGRKHRCST